MQGIDVAQATADYLALLSQEGHAKAIAYTRGGHWLLLWGTLVSLLSAWLILRSGVLTRVVRAIERRRPRRNLATLAAAFVFLLCDFVLTLPWFAYAAWWREKAYGLNNQTFGAWIGEAVVGAAINAVLLGLLLTVVYALVRRAPRTWWLWASGVTGAFVVLAVVIAPVFIEPIFNTYAEAPPGAVRDAVVELARENDVPSDKIYVYDGSRQSDRYTANVSGLFGTARVAMSDAMLQRASLPEVRAVVGHEMGHYALRHVLWSAAWLSLVAVAVFWLIGRGFGLACRLMGARDVQGLGDPTGLPVLWAMVAVIGLLLTPVLNSIIRISEEEADRFSLERAREPDGLASALVKTIEYRAASPTKLEEVIFYSHPSVENRVRRAMEWKAANGG